MRAGIAWIALCAAPTLAEACSAPPIHLYVSGARLVAGSETIILAKVTDIVRREAGTVYVFETVKVVKGNDLRRSFSLQGALPSKKPETTFENHASKTFWDSWGGRSGHDTDCLIHPSFALNETYLVFSASSSKSYERIADAENDRWLKWVWNEVWSTKRLEDEERETSGNEKRAKREQAEREARCVVKPVMSDADIARCR